MNTTEEIFEIRKLYRNFGEWDQNLHNLRRHV